MNFFYKSSFLFVFIGIGLVSCVQTKPIQKSSGNPVDLTVNRQGTSSVEDFKNPKGASPHPVYLSQIDNINKFDYFANGGGWDADYYVGYNTCWVVKLPPAPKQKFKRAFLGAKLGRMKRESIPGRPSWEKRIIKGEVNIAIAHQALWPYSHHFLLSKTKDIPLEGDSQDAISGVGESQWFWTEISLRHVNFEGPNYVTLFSPSRRLSNKNRAPILAAGPNDKNKNAWLNTNVKGRPPFSKKETLKNAVHFKPAIVLKLVPENEKEVKVTLDAFPRKGSTIGRSAFFSASISGENIQSAWIEFSTDTVRWIRATRPLTTPPYSFTVKKNRLLEGDHQIRVSAVDIWENQGVSKSIKIYVPEKRGKKAEKVKKKQ